jgi:hypothetical protein
VNAKQRLTLWRGVPVGERARVQRSEHLDRGVEVLAILDVGSMSTRS